MQIRQIGYQLPAEAPWPYPITITGLPTVCLHIVWMAVCSNIVTTKGLKVSE